MADSKDTDKTRRDLYAISIGLIIFNVAGGTFASDASTVFGAVHISRPWALALCIWIAWAYFLWRFWLSARPIFKPYFDDIDSEITRSNRWTAYNKRIGTLLASLRDRHTESLPEETASDRGSLLVNSHTIERMMREGDGRPASGKFGAYSQRLLDLDLSNDYMKTIHARTQMSVQDRIRMVSKAAFTASLARHAFSDTTLPFCVALLAPVLFILRLIFGVVTF